MLRPAGVVYRDVDLVKLQVPHDGLSFLSLVVAEHRDRPGWEGQDGTEKRRVCAGVDQRFAAPATISA
ncbi:hypothetical protein GCM10010278_80830 [Streptomyces melanogenes]|nr:hypothetical protein GCM10010278_80830 [Streptomyces melanogenes]